VAHACNPNYSGGRNTDDQGSKSAWANISKYPMSKIPFTKMGQQSGSESKCEVLSSNPSTAKKKKSIDI
jgi:hypothetical protein